MSSRWRLDEYRMIDISSRDLQRADSTFGLLVMFGSHHCEPCATLRPHLTALQMQLNSG